MVHLVVKLTGAKGCAHPYPNETTPTNSAFLFLLTTAKQVFLDVMLEWKIRI